MTRSAEQFIGPTTFEALTGRPVHRDMFRPQEHPQGEHIGLAGRAELMIVAPATADYLAKVAHGLADDLLSTLALTIAGPALLAPAMNTEMWNKPSVQRNVVADETRKTLNRLGVKETLYEAYTAGEKDYSALVSKLKVNGIAVLYVGGYHTEAGLIVRQMRQQGMKTVLVSGDALVTNEYWSITGKAGEGTLMTFSPDPRKEKAAAEVVAKFRAGGYEPEGYTLYTYGAIQAWAQAVEKIGGTDTDKLSRHLKSNQFDTVLGRFGFDKKGDVTAPGYVFYEWKDGKYDYYVAPGA